MASTSADISFLGQIRGVYLSRAMLPAAHRCNLHYGHSWSDGTFQYSCLKLSYQLAALILTINMRLCNQYNDTLCQSVIRQFDGGWVDGSYKNQLDSLHIEGQSKGSEPGLTGVLVPKVVQRPQGQRVIVISAFY